MQLIFIRIGKAWKVIQRDGVWRGTRRVLAGFLKMFQSVGSGDILFVTGGVGDSALYRTEHHAEELRFHGFKVSVTLQDNPRLLKYVERFKVFILHRTLFTPQMQKFMARAKELRREVIFETDDLVYDPQYVPFMRGFDTMNALERKLYENGVGGEIVSDPYVKACTVTTTPLAEALREKGKQVFRVPNKLSQHDVEVGETLYRERIQESPMVSSSSSGSLDPPRQTRDDSVAVGYFSGTLSHNKDFATITQVLIRLFKKYSQVKLVIAGPLDIEPELEPYRSRIMALPYVPRDEYFGNVAKVDMCVAPLEIGNPFCEAKSELKWFEPGMLGIPAVVAGTRPFREAVHDGVDGFVASTPEEWFAKIEKLIADPGLRQVVGEKAREKVLQEFTTINAKNEAYYNYLRSKL